MAAVIESPILLIALPLAAAFFALAGKLLRIELAASIAAIILLAASAVPLALTARAVLDGTPVQAYLGGWAPPLGITMRLDTIAWIGSSLITLISTLVSIASLSTRSYRATYFFFLSLMVSGMQIVTLTADIFTMFVGFEIIAISAYVLIAFDQSDAGLLASLKYLLLSSVGILFFLVGVYLVYRDIGSLSLDAISRAVRGTGLGDSRSMHLAVAALCVGIGVRTAFVPFHTWLPEAHAYAPHPVSALLSGVLIKVSLFAMMRILWVFGAGYLFEVLLWIGAGTALLAVIWALAQHDIKRLLAYHSISQMGYILAAFGAASIASVSGAFAHAIAHAVFKSLLFLAAGEAIRVTGTRDLYRMRGLARRAPLLSGGLLVGALSIAAVPPFVGFASKQIVTATLSGTAAYVMLWVTSAGTVASFIKVGWAALRGQGEEAVEVAAAEVVTADRVQERAWSGVPARVSIVALAGLCLAAGLLSAPVGTQLARALATGGPSAEPGVAQASATAIDSARKIFSSGKLLATLPVLAAGALIYAGAVSALGRRVAARIAALRPQIGTVLLFFVAGLLVFAAVAMLTP
jgi:multicomponent Na+:H+ antiporter subunit D